MMYDSENYRFDSYFISMHKYILFSDISFYSTNADVTSAINLFRKTFLKWLICMIR